MLLGHLARFSSFFDQGELLCTQGLAYLLGDGDARDALGDYVESIGVPHRLGSDLTWRPEAVQPDGGRPDLEARTSSRELAAKIEAKLDAHLDQSQLRSYVAHLQENAHNGVLLVLVPHRRAREISSTVTQVLSVSGDSPWLVPGTRTCSVAVICWEDLISALKEVRSVTFRCELLQFEAMYEVFKRYDIVPPTSDAELLAWRDHWEMYWGICHKVSRGLTLAHGLLPRGWDDSDRIYYRRYVSMPWGEYDPYFSIGVRDPFEGFKTPVWGRFHRDTQGFRVIRERMTTSLPENKRVESGGHLWVPLDIPLNAPDGDVVVDTVLAQARAILEIATQPLPKAR